MLCSSEEVAAALQEQRAVAGQLYPPRGAVEQLGAQLRLQPAHRGGHAGLGQAQAVGGAGEAAKFGDAEEDAVMLELVHGLFTTGEQRNRMSRVYQPIWHQ